MGRLLWIMLVVAVLVGGACDDQSVDGTGGTETDGPVLFEAGTPIGSGFVVPVGSVALTQPILGGGADNAQATAMWSSEFVPADPIEAINDMVGQATELGFELSGFTPTPCVVDDEQPDSGTSSQTAWPLPEGSAVPRSVSCNALGHRVRDGVVDQLTVSTHQAFTEGLGRTPATGGSISIERVPSDVEALRGQYEYAPTAVAPMPADFPRASGTPAPPDLAPGERLVPTEGSGFTVGSAPRLVEGSRLVVPARSPICQGGFAAVIDVTGDPDVVMAGYVEQLAAWSAEYGGPPTTEESTLFDRRIVHSVASVDGTSLVATMVVGLDGEPTRMNYSTCSG